MEIDFFIKLTRSVIYVLVRSMTLLDNFLKMWIFMFLTMCSQENAHVHICLEEAPLWEAEQWSPKIPT